MKNDLPPPKLSFACPKQWDSMRPAGSQERFCEQCQLHVRDLSAMSKAAAREHLAQTTGHHCVSYEVRPDGSMVTRTPWTILGRPCNALWKGVVALIGMVAPLGLASCADRTVGRTGGPPVMTGQDYPAPPGTSGPQRLTGAVATSPMDNR